MATLYRTAYHVHMKTFTAWYEQKRPRTGTSRSHSPTHCTGTVGRRRFGAENGMVWYLLPFQWVPIFVPIYSLPLRFECLFTLPQRVAQEPIRYVAIHFQDRSVTEIAPKCEQKPYPI